MKEVSNLPWRECVSQLQPAAGRGKKGNRAAETRNQIYYDQPGRKKTDHHQERMAVLESASF